MQWRKDAAVQNQHGTLWPLYTHHMEKCTKQDHKSPSKVYTVYLKKNKINLSSHTGTVHVLAFLHFNCPTKNHILQAEDTIPQWSDVTTACGHLFPVIGTSRGQSVVKRNLFDWTCCFTRQENKTQRPSWSVLQPYILCCCNRR